MRLRFFGGADLPDGLFDPPGRVTVADAAGVPMGGELTIDESGRGPSFLALAMRDPGTPE